MLKNVHPGDVLREEFLQPLGMTQYLLAKRLGVPPTQIGQIVAGKRAVTPLTALRLSRFFGTTAQFWLNLQAAYDLEEQQREHLYDLQAIEPYENSAPRKSIEFGELAPD